MKIRTCYGTIRTSNLPNNFDIKEGKYMAVSYNGLWKLLIDKNMKKVDLMNRIEISSSTLAKMTKEELVSLKVLEKICAELECDFGDIIHYEKE